MTEFATPRAAAASVFIQRMIGSRNNVRRCKATPGFQDSTGFTQKGCTGLEVVG
jgi:hypothetical protein